MRNKLLLIVIFILGFSCLTATPQYSLITGNKCIACHYNYQGGGQRNELGTYYNCDVSLINPASIGLGGIYTAITRKNSAIDPTLSYGIDFRYMSMRPGGSFLMPRRYFLMETEPYLNYRPIEELSFSGAYNFAKTPHPGQQKWSASATYQPSLLMPSLKIGFFTPSTGLHFDDHTMFTKQIAMSTLIPIIPPDLAEYGAEINYDGMKWLSASAGAFTTKNFGKNTTNGSTAPLVNDKAVAVSLRLALYHRLFDDLINTNAGASAYIIGSNEFNLYSAFVGIGYRNYISLIAEYSVIDKAKILQTHNYALDLTCRLLDELYLNLRAEQGRTDDKIENASYKLSQYLIGFRAFILPYISVMPEYRIFVNPNFSSYAAQYAVQLHVFY